MKFGVGWSANAAAYYRARMPMQEMERRGHEVVWPSDDGGSLDRDRLLDCDVVHVYRRRDARTYELLSELRQRGTAIVWDNDDDFRALPKESPRYQRTGGRNGEMMFRETLWIARVAHRLTVPSERLARVYAKAGVKHVEVVPNALGRGRRPRRRRHAGVVIGWIAGMEHLADVQRLRLPVTFTALQDELPDVRVKCIGVDLALTRRYEHTQSVPFLDLPGRMAGFDIGIAPLADIPFNSARSDIKVKEYAASGIPWLASPVGPYAGLGEAQGGRLVGNDEWLDALRALATDKKLRKRLGRAGEAWAKTVSVAQTADAWEALWQDAAAACDGGLLQPA